MSKGASINSKSEGVFGHGYTALMWASEYGHLQIVDVRLRSQTFMLISK